MGAGALLRRLLLWTAFVVLGTLAMADENLLSASRVTFYQVSILAAILLGIGTLLHRAGDPQRSGARTICRIVIAYLVFEMLVVLPVALWLGSAKVMVILGSMLVRFTWLLFPVVLALCSDQRARRVAGVVAIAAAICLAAWGAYSAATGGGGYYMDGSEIRWRVLTLGGLLLFAWPFVLALSRAAPRRYTAALVGVSLVGLVLANSRSGLIAFAVAGLACLFMSGQIRRLAPWIVPVALIGSVMGFLWEQQATGAASYTFTHLLDFGSGGGADRVMRWRLAWDFFASRPINDYVWSWRYYAGYLANPYEPHNFLIQIAVYEGVAGLMFYGSVLTVSLRHAWDRGRRDAETRALTGYLIAYLVFCLANTNGYDRATMPLLVAALAALVARTDELRATEASGSLAAEVLDLDPPSAVNRDV